jgi:ferritin-like metal-binding protein YciE
MEFNTLNDVLVEDLADLFSAERQLVEALPGVAAAAHSYDLRDVLESHLEETRVHVERLQEILADLRIGFAPAKTCKAMQGLIEEVGEIAAAGGDAVAHDAALIGAAQRLEQYEIVSYRTARALAGELGFERTSALLDATLDEEEKANKALARLAAGGMLSSGINRLAAQRSDTSETSDEAESAVVASEAGEADR